ncbi:MAG: aldo/keto reductase [Gammaproteobacteria bacterium]|nr:aldo/keto reductase [Gammaproteobacteria bacterium]
MKPILGTMTFGDQVDKEQASIMLSSFHASGYRELDTAHVYHDGATEALLGRLVSEDKHFSIATKVHPWNEKGLQPQRVKQQFCESLVRLNVDKVDLLYLHSPDICTPIIDTLEACYDLYQDGLFSRFGLSNFAAWQVAEVVGICQRKNWMQPTIYEGLYNGLNRDVESELLPCLHNYGIAFYAYNPLAGGLLTGKYRDIHNKPNTGRFGTYDAYPERYWKADYFKVLQFVHVCEKNDILPGEAALRWLCQHSMIAPDHSPLDNGVILGVSNQSHLDQNLNAFGAENLPQTVVDVLDQGWDITRKNCFRYFRI